MAEAVGLSVASASIAAVQLVSRLQSIASAFFKSVIASQDFKVLQTRYDRELGRLSVILQVLRPEDPNSPSIPMHVFEELYLELRKQAVALELFQNAKLGSASTLAAKVSLFRWTLKDKHRIEEFIALVERYSDILERMVQLNTPMLMRSQKLTLQPEKFVSAPLFCYFV
jgi:hypothetical protein